MSKSTLAHSRFKKGQRAQVDLDLVELRHHQFQEVGTTGTIHPPELTGKRSKHRPRLENGSMVQSKLVSRCLDRVHMS